MIMEVKIKTNGVIRANLLSEVRNFAEDEISDKGCEFNTVL